MSEDPSIIKKPLQSSDTKKKENDLLTDYDTVRKIRRDISSTDFSHRKLYLIKSLNVAIGTKKESTVEFDENSLRILAFDK